MAFDREAAKADGWTDEEIDKYIATKDQPLPAEVPRDRGEEITGTITSAVPETVTQAAKYGLGGYGVYKLGQALGRMGGPGPVAPPAPPMTPPVAPPAPPMTPPVAPPAPIAEPAPTTFTGGKNPAWDRALSQPYKQPFLQRATDIAGQMRQYAAQRVLPAAGVPGAVIGGGAAATGLASGQMAAMTPEQRRAYYNNQMLGAMGGDASLAAAIMNRGQ